LLVGTLFVRAGEALLTLAAAYPKSTFHGYDIAQKSLDSAAIRRVVLKHYCPCMLTGCICVWLSMHISS